MQWTMLHDTTQDYTEFTQYYLSKIVLPSAKPSIALIFFLETAPFLWKTSEKTESVDSETIARAFCASPNLNR